MRSLKPFTLTSEAVSWVKEQVDEWGYPKDGLRVSVYYVGGAGSRQYDLDISPGEPTDVILSFPEGPLIVYVDRESFMRLWGYRLDVYRLSDPRGICWGLCFKDPQSPD